MADGSRSNGQLNTRRDRMTDAGFSLVELLIAVTILAIIVIPLLHMFITSTRINVKSRQTLRATTVAQDIMEGLKAYSLEEVRTQFSLPDGTASSSFFAPTEGFYIINSKMIQGGVREITELEKNRDADGNVVYVNDPDADRDNEIYYFGIQKLKMQGGEYDALIKLDASTYTEDKKGTADGHDNAFNGYYYYNDVMSVAETGSNSEKDSSYHESQDLSADVIKDIKKQIEDDVINDPSGLTLPADWEDKWKDLKIEDIIVKREILVTFKDAHDVDVENNPRCEAVVTFKYTCKYDGAPAPYNTEYTSYGSTGSGGEVKDITRIFSSGNFYLFYYPIYKRGATSPVDDIVFDIQDVGTLFDANRPMLKSITLAKQIRSFVDTDKKVIVPDMKDSDLWEAESNYKARVTINPTGNSAVSDILTFRTNIDTNMSEMARSVEDDGTVIWDDIGGVLFDVDHNIETRALVGDVYDKITNVIYDIEITVYKAGAAQYFGEADFEDREDVVKLATITNLN